VRLSLQGAPIRVLHGEAAGAAEVREALSGTNVVHFSCHAMFDSNHPLQSFLLMASGAQLTIGELMPVISRQAFRLVVLSACETGMARITATPDEFLGFPSAFLHAGTEVVLATLWPVDDAAAAVLTGRFYYEWRQRGKSPARALQDAQNWLRGRYFAAIGLRGRRTNHPCGCIGRRCRTLLRGINPFSPFANPVSGRHSLCSEG
jgi:CHAT domain-containing protein